MSKEKLIDLIVARIGAEISEEQLKEAAVEALKGVVNDYDVQKKLRELVEPMILQTAKDQLQSKNFQKVLQEVTKQGLVGIVECSVKQICAQLIKTLQK